MTNPVANDGARGETWEKVSDHCCPYSYIMNNPLSGTDPSAYFPVLIPIIAKAVGRGLSAWGAYESGYERRLPS